MRIGRETSPGVQSRVVILTADEGFEESVRATFGTSPRIGLDVVKGRLSARDEIDVDGATVVVADIDAGDEAELEALQHLLSRIGSWPPVVAITQSFDGGVARRLMQMRVADCLVKPVPPVELVRTCARVAKSANNAPANAGTTEAQIFTFL